MLLKSFRPEEKSTKNSASNTSRRRFEQLEPRMMLSAQAYDWNNAVIKGQGFVDGMVYSQAAPNTFFAHTDIGGAYRWDPSASNWIPVTDWIQAGDSAQNLGAQAMAADPTDASKVYLVIGTYGSTAGILRSSDGGRTWLRTDVSGIKVDGNGWGRGLGDRIAVDPNSPDILFYGAQNYDSTHRGLWKSTDSAATWNQVSSFTSYGEQWDSSYSGAKGVGSNFVIFDKSTGTPGSATPVIYTTAATIANTNTKLYRTTNGGTTWSPMPNQPTTTNFPLRAALSADGTVMYVTYGSQAGPLASADGGGVVYKITNPSSANPTWTEVATNAKLGLSSGIFGPIAIDPTDNNTIYTATMNSWPSNIFRSTNGGSTWTALNPNSAANRDNSPAPLASWGTIHSLTDLDIDPFNRNVAMFNTGGGVWRTSNLTATAPTWTFFNDGLEETAVLDVVSPNTGDVHVFSAMGDCDGFRHADLSVSPPALGQSQSPSLQQGTSDDIDVAWNDANYLIRLSRHSSPYVQYSNDNGVTWAWMPSTGVSGTNNPDEYNANLGMTALSADGLYVVYQPGNNSTTDNLLIYSSRSSLTGAWSSWQAPATNRPPEGAKVVADLVAAHTFYAIKGTAVYRSTDGGVNWTTMTTSGAPSSIKWVRAVPGYSGHLLASAQWNGLYRSTDGGATWTRINSSAVTTANGVGVGMAAPGQNYPAIFVSGTVNGLNGFFRSDDQGATWVTISDLTHQYGLSNVIQGDPRIYGRVYLAGSGRGLVYGDIHTSPTSLPSGWSTQDIGAVGSAGAAGSSDGGSSWELIGGGGGINRSSDAFHFAYTTLTGDGTITAQVMDVPNYNPSNHNALAGVMIRNDLGAGSEEVLAAMSPGSVNGAVLKYRTSSGGSTTTVTSPGVWNPYWVQLTRSGDNFTASRSADGVIWTPIGSATVTMGSTVYVGLATTGADNNQLNTSSFHNVNITTGSVTAPAAPTALSGAVVTNRRIDLSWVDNATNETYYFVERATNSSFTQNLATTTLGSNATSYQDTSVVPSTTYYYRIRAYNTGGYSAYSDVVNYTTTAPTPPAAPTDLNGTVVSSSRIDLSWTDNASNESAFYIDRATNSSFTQNLATNSVGSNTTSYQDTGLSASTTYYYRVRANNIDGYSGYSNVVNDTTLASTSIFTGNQDIGSFTPAGSYSENSGVYTVNGAGSDVQGTSDQFQFAYLSLTGNGTITARVDSVENTDAWAKAGLMFRNTLDANSANAFLALTPGNGVTFQSRSSANGNTNWMNTSGLSAPYWVRLTRSGNNFTAYRSVNGVDWTQIGSTTAITMNSTVYVGLAVTSHSTGNLCTSAFSNVSVTTPPLPDADFDGDGDIDGRDFLAWQRGYGIQAPIATKANGDADNDLDVDGNDLGIWQEQYGTAGAVAAATSLSDGTEVTPAALVESVSVESPTVANALQPLSAELVDVAMAWDLASRPRQKVHPAPAALGEKVHPDRPVSRAQSMPWHAGSNNPKQLEFGRVDNIFDFEGDGAAYEELLDRLFAEDESVRSAMRIFMFAR
jgi:xyloglucan-specific exo-beta-1,4-glucanase